MEADGGAIVIRFPPAAPHPFLAGTIDAGGAKVAEAPVAVAPEPEPPPIVDLPEAEPVEMVSEPPAIEEVEAEAEAEFDVDVDEVDVGVAVVDDEPELMDAPEELAEQAAEEVKPAAQEGVRKKRRRGRRKRTKPAEEAPEEPSVEAEPESPPAEAAGSAEARPARLSASQRRRLRRKRRSERPRSETPQAAEAGGKPEASKQAAKPERPADRKEAPAPQKQPASQKQQPAASQKQPAPVSHKQPAPAAVSGERPPKEMIINVFPREECRIAILHKGLLEEIYIERASSENHVGNIYKGVITNVEPSIQAAFVDFGLGKNGFLHISDLHPQYFPDGGQPAENVGCKIPRRNRPPIQRCLRRGQQLIVQITKEGIGTKGPTLSTYLSIPGRFLVMMPGMRRLGVSRKIEDDDTRHKLRGQLSELELPDGVGFIARTAAQGRTKRELQSDLKYLTRLWRAVEQRVKDERAPAELYRESDLVIRTIRDLYSADIGRIVVDDAAVAKRAREFLRIFSPRSGDMVVEYTDSAPVFHKYGVEAELDRLHSRHVPLKSGGSLVIEPTEALVAIDVNSGRFRTEDDAEATAFKINMEAADEIARQLRLRDLGGVIICDFIDMRFEAHKREIERQLAKNLKEHKERAKILRMSAFGIIEMTRQRQRASLTRSIYQDCHQCRGTGLVRTAESVTLDVMRTLKVNVVRDSVYLIEVVVSPEVAMRLLNRKRGVLNEMEATYRRTITIQPNTQFGLDQVEIRCWDQRGRSLPQV